MIFLSTHKHSWVATGERHHDCPVYACNICGDRAFDSAPHSDYGQLETPESQGSST